MLVKVACSERHVAALRSTQLSNCGGIVLDICLTLDLRLSGGSDLSGWVTTKGIPQLARSRRLCGLPTLLHHDI